MLISKHDKKIVIFDDDCTNPVIIVEESSFSPIYHIVISKIVHYCNTNHKNVSSYLIKFMLWWGKQDGYKDIHTQLKFIKRNRLLHKKYIDDVEKYVMIS